MLRLPRTATAAFLSCPVVFYSLLQLIKWKGASDEIILISLAGCAMYGLLLSSSLQDGDDDTVRNHPNNSRRIIDLPVHRYTTRQQGQNDDRCVFCWEPYQTGDSVSYGPSCRHMYHAQCVHKWTSTQKRRDCPYCRCSLLQQQRFVAFEELFRAR